MPEHINTVVIGAGQAGLCTSYYLSQQDHEHVVLEQADMLAPAWRQRWDSFTLVTPNWALQLPDYPYQGDDPDGFLPKKDVIDYVEGFAATFDPPVRFGVRATSVTPQADGKGYEVETSDGRIEADNVVVAAGTFQKPRIPEFSAKLADDVVQLHSSQYRNPGALPEGAVLVVGAGQSGSQIAEELYKSGRKVYLSISKVRRLPRRYRGADMMHWLDKMGIMTEKAESLDSPALRFVPNPRVTGKDGGYTLSLHRFAAEGVTLLGHVEAAQGTTVYLAPDLKESLGVADEFAAEIRKGVDRFVAMQSLDAPSPADTALPQDGYDSEMIRELDLKAAGINAIVWATGYAFEFRWMNMPLLDDYGYPVQERGVTEYPGLYFVGLHYLDTLKSGLLYGVGEDAAHVTEHLLARN
jgi:putative flavoprotein involved in K+ transport